MCSGMSLLAVTGATSPLRNASQLVRSAMLRFSVSNRKLTINYNIEVAANVLLPTAAALQKPVQGMYMLNLDC